MVRVERIEEQIAHSHRQNHAVTKWKPPSWSCLHYVCSGESGHCISGCVIIAGVTLDTGPISKSREAATNMPLI